MIKSTECYNYPWKHWLNTVFLSLFIDSILYQILELFIVTSNALSIYINMYKFIIIDLYGVARGRCNTTFHGSLHTIHLIYAKSSNEFFCWLKLCKTLVLKTKHKFIQNIDLIKRFLQHSCSPFHQHFTSSFCPRLFLGQKIT